MAGETVLDNINPIGKLFYSAGRPAGPFLCLSPAKAQGGRYQLGPQVSESTWRALLSKLASTRSAGLPRPPFNRVFEATRHS